MLREKLKRLMEEKNLNVNQLAIAIDTPYSTVSDWIKGLTKPKTDKLLKLAKYFNVPIEYFLKEG